MLTACCVSDELSGKFFAVINLKKEVFVLLDLFKPSPVLDEESVVWLFDLYEWALQNFGADIFFEQSVLVVPSNQFFPGTADSTAGMAQIIFDKVKEYAALKHWPCRLTTEQSCATESVRIALSGAIRDANGHEPANVPDEESLPVVYDPRQVNNPEAIIATFAHTLAHYLGAMAHSVPPGAKENWPQATEVLAVFLGFGVMFSNSAFVYRNVTCGSCQPNTVNRQSWLSQYDITYALAIFAVLKNIPAGQVTKHLKASLRSFFKKAYKEVKKRDKDINRLLALREQQALAQLS
jgi:hypothetical protein